ncbi:transcriptional regulator [Gammaproteobacteria bacterium LSUCC0112]|nr:transcriptional regulator [Gammaproteobacteria bacterium LSUCC0112]
MQLPVDSADAVGIIVRASRKAQNIRHDDAAGSIGVRENFLGKVDRGSESVQWGKLFQVLHGLGVRVVLDVPEIVADHLSQQHESQAKP